MLQKQCSPSSTSSSRIIGLYLYLLYFSFTVYCKVTFHPKIKQFSRKIEPSLSYCQDCDLTFLSVLK